VSFGDRGCTPAPPSVNGMANQETPPGGRSVGRQFPLSGVYYQLKVPVDTLTVW
jgi:hypothetical protein